VHAQKLLRACTLSAAGTSCSERQHGLDKTHYRRSEPGGDCVDRVRDFLADTAEDVRAALGEVQARQLVHLPRASSRVRARACTRAYAPTHVDVLGREAGQRRELAEVRADQERLVRDVARGA
jgi:hypothetical protein